MQTISAAVAYVGMLMILGAFVLETRGSVSSRGRIYLGAMALGSALLALRAAHSQEWAFLILEVVWCAAAIIALLRPRRSTADS